MNNNSEQNKSKIFIDVGNNINSNSKNQINYKNINTTQTDKTLNHNKKYIQYIKPLLFLLQKAEQIISIINLPSSSIDKYNQLKEISFKKCGLEYTPLVKNNNLIKNFQKENNNNINNNNNELNKIKSDKIIHILSNSKNKLLDLILTFIETNHIMNINSNKNNKETKSFLNNSNDFNTNCNILKEEINNLINEKNINLQNTSENQINSEECKIFKEKEKLINFIARAQENVISVLYENDKKFNELKEAFLNQNTQEEYLNKYISSIDDLISPIWNKYYNNEVDWFNPNKIIDNYELKTYTKCHFLLNFMNQLFTDNKNLMEALTETEKKKNEAFNVLQLPYIRKVIEKSEYLKNIEELLGKLNNNINKDKSKETDMNKLINDGKELINCIKETIMEEPMNQKGDNDTLKDGNNSHDLYNYYNDDMNIFLGKLMNGIQNILNKVDISIKKDELIESMIKVNMSKNKNISVDSSIANVNNTNTNLNNTNVNINMSNANLNNITAINNGVASKDISFISTNNNNDINSSKIQNMSFQSFQVYKKKTNHISGSNVIINSSTNNFNKSDIEFSEKKVNKFGINDAKNGEIKKKIINNIMNVKEKENDDGILNKDKITNNNQSNNELNDKILIQSINNIINDKNNKDMKNNDNNEINNEDIINEEKSITVGDIGNNLSDLENSQKIKKLNSPTKEENIIKNYIKNNIKKEDDITDEGLEKLKNMVLEDFKSRLNEEKEKENDE